MRSTELSRSIPAACTPNKTDAIGELTLVPPSPANRSVQHQLCGLILGYLNTILLLRPRYVPDCASVVFSLSCNLCTF